MCCFEGTARRSFTPARRSRTASANRVLERPRRNDSSKSAGSSGSGGGGSRRGGGRGGEGGGGGGGGGGGEGGEGVEGGAPAGAIADDEVKDGAEAGATPPPPPPLEQAAEEGGAEASTAAASRPLGLFRRISGLFSGASGGDGAQDSQRRGSGSGALRPAAVRQLSAPSELTHPHEHLLSPSAAAAARPRQPLRGSQRGLQRGGSIGGAPSPWSAAAAAAPTPFVGRRFSAAEKRGSITGGGPVRTGPRRAGSVDETNPRMSHEEYVANKNTRKNYQFISQTPISFMCLAAARNLAKKL